MSIFLHKGMTINGAPPHLWTPRDGNPLRHGKTYGVDVSMILYAMIYCANIYRCLSRTPPASVQHLVATWCDEWYRVHQFESKGIKLVFVFDGRDCRLKRLRRLQRDEDTRKWQSVAAGARTWQELDKANAKLVRVNGHVVHAFCEWARSKIAEDKFCLFGAPFEADVQLVVLEKDGYTDGSLTEDGDVYFYEGACNLYSGFNTRSTRKYRTIINRTRM